MLSRAQQPLPWRTGRKDSVFASVAVWRGCAVDDVPAVKAFFVRELDTRIKPVGCVPHDSGRLDFVFLVHTEDIGKFSIRRFKLSEVPRWLDDDISSHYPKAFRCAYD